MRYDSSAFRIIYNNQEGQMSLPDQAEAEALQIGRSFSSFGGAPRIGLLSKKFTGFRSKLDDTVGIIGKSS